MKTTLTFLLTAIMLLTPVLELRADDTPYDGREADTVLILTPIRRKNPKMPATIYIECRYSADHITFVMPDNAQYLEVTLSREETTVWQTTVTRQNPTAVIPSLSGEYDIIYRTDGNQIFGGEITF